MNAIDGFRDRCRARLGNVDADAGYRVRPIGNTPQLSRSLLQLIARGEKTGLFSDPAAMDPVPAAGEYFIFTDHAGKPHCMVRLTESRVLRFADVGPAETACESPAARDPAAWRKIHGRYWQGVCAAAGREFSEEMPLLFQRFELLYAEDEAAG
ncbi:MAG: ASCH domain-containing protein [Gammaproteobacteria bacterium]|nr:ASCH domain-containing protein [Gammaproteobacteria bacterium]